MLDKISAFRSNRPRQSLFSVGDGRPAQADQIICKVIDDFGVDLAGIGGLAQEAAAHDIGEAFEQPKVCFRGPAERLEEDVAEDGEEGG